MATGQIPSRIYGQPGYEPPARWVTIYKPRLGLPPTGAPTIYRPEPLPAKVISRPPGVRIPPSDALVPSGYAPPIPAEEVLERIPRTEEERVARERVMTELMASIERQEIESMKARAERRALGISPYMKIPKGEPEKVLAPMRWFQEQAEKISAQIPTEYVYSEEKGRWVKATLTGTEFIRGAIETGISLPAMPLQVAEMGVYIAKEPVKGIGEIAAGMAKEPARALGGIVTMAAAGYGLGRIYGWAKGKIRGKKYEVTYLKGIESTQQELDIVFGKGFKPGKVRVGEFRAEFRPGVGYRIIPTKELVKPGVLDIGKITVGKKGIGLKARVEYDFPKTYTIVKRFKKPPKVPEVVGIYEPYQFGIATKSLIKSGEQAFGISKEAVVRFGYPIEFKAPPGWKVTKIVTKGEPTLKPFTEPSLVKPVSPGAYGRAEAFGKAVPDITKGKPITAPTQIAPLLKPVVWKVKAIPETLEYISPAAAGILGITTPRVPSLDVSLKQDLSAWKPAKVEPVAKIGVALKKDIGLVEPSLALVKKPKVDKLFRQAIGQPQVTRIKPAIDIGRIPAFKQVPVSKTIQKEQQKMAMRTRAITKVRAKFPFPKPMPWGFPLPPLVWREPKPFKIRRRKRRPFRQPRRYTPSLTAIVLGIRAKEKPRRRIYTGLEVRPMLPRKRRRDPFAADFGFRKHRGFGFRPMRGMPLGRGFKTKPMKFGKMSFGKFKMPGFPKMSFKKQKEFEF